MSILDRIDNAFAADLDCNTDKVILLALARHADEFGACWLSWSTLESATKRARGTVWRALRRLENAGEIVRRNWFVESQYGRQSANCYILTSIADTPEKVEAAFLVISARRKVLESRQRDGEGRADATGRVALPRPLEVIPVSDPPNPYGEIGVSGCAAPLTEGGEVELQLQQPTDAATQDEAAPTTANDTSTAPDLPAALSQAWLDTFGELTDKQSRFISNAARTYDATEVLRALGIVAGQLEKGQKIAAPAAYVKTILTRNMNEIGAGHRTAKQTPAGGHRNQTDWSAVAEQTSQAAPEGLRTFLVDTEQVQSESDEERARSRQRVAERKEQERIAAEQKQIEQERKEQAATAAYADRRRRDAANQVVAATECSIDAALSVADEFLGAVLIAKLQDIRLDSMMMHRNRAGSALSIDAARNLLVRGSLVAVPA